MSLTAVAVVTYIVIGVVGGLVVGAHERSSAIDDIEAGVVAFWVFVFWPVVALVGLFALAINAVSR